MDLGNLLPFFIAFLFLVGLAAVIGGVVYFILRLRAGERVTVSLRFLLSAYLYLASIVGLMVLVHGAALLLNAGLSIPLGRDFSYSAQPIFRPMGTLETRESREGKLLTGQPTIEEQRAQRARMLERSYREGILNGAINAFFGGLVWGVHLFARRRLEAGTETQQDILRKPYLIVLLLIFGIGSVITLPSGTFEAIRYYVIEPVEEFEFRNPPGPKLATSVIFTPVWVLYLLATLREVKKMG